MERGESLVHGAVVAVVHHDDLRPTGEVPGEAQHVPTGLVHQFEALEHTDVLEASTPHLDDVVRLKDRYGRA